MFTCCVVTDSLYQQVLDNLIEITVMTDKIYLLLRVIYLQNIMFFYGTVQPDLTNLQNISKRGTRDLRTQNNQRQNVTRQHGKALHV